MISYKASMLENISYFQIIILLCGKAQDILYASPGLAIYGHYIV
jgi:hypothetical protein